MNDKKFRILQYVESRMSYVAPNLSIILGSTVAAKIMGESFVTYLLKPTSSSTMLELLAELSIYMRADLGSNTLVFVFSRI